LGQVSEKKVISSGRGRREADLAACLRGVAMAAGAVKPCPEPQSLVGLMQNCARACFSSEITHDCMRSADFPRAAHEFWSMQDTVIAALRNAA
jgi:hypothetical protein